MLVPIVGGHRLHGTARVPDLGGSFRYEVRVDDAWQPVAVHVRLDLPGRVAELEVSRDGDRWSVDGEHRPDLDGCLDVWLDLTPAALTPTLRHRELTEHGETVYDVVLIEVADLVVSRDTHALARLDAEHYIHRADADHGFQVHVGPKELVVEYEDAWKAVAFA